MLDQDADEALQRAENGAMDHHRHLAVAVLVDVLRAETVRHGKVQLDSAQLPHTIEAVTQRELDLGPVEGTFARLQLEIQILVFQAALQRRFGFVPDRVRADTLFRPGRELDQHLVEAEVPVHRVQEVDERADLGPDLGFGTEDMGIVLGEAAHAHQAMHDPGALVAIDRSQLGPADRELAIAAQGAGVGQHMEGAVHRFECEQLVAIGLGHEHFVRAKLLPVA